MNDSLFSYFQVTKPFKKSYNKIDLSEINLPLFQILNFNILCNLKSWNTVLTKLYLLSIVHLLFL